MPKLKGPGTWTIRMFRARWMFATDGPWALIFKLVPRRLPGKASK
jgi:hypothetical protein